MKDPFIERLAAFRGISYEQAEKQHKEEVLIEDTEFAMVTGKNPAELAEERPLFEKASVRQLPAKQEEEPPSIVKRWLRSFFHPPTPEEKEMFLILETERKMLGEQHPVQRALNVAAGLDKDAEPVATVVLAPPPKRTP